MQDFCYLIENFFTHKDFLLPAEQIPGTLFTPLHFIFSSIALAIVILSAIYVAKHKKLIKPVFIAVLITLVAFEFIIVTWESVSGKEVGLDLTSNLSLYPCSIFMYAMPFAIWGKGLPKRMACGYVCTLGLLGSAINFLYPAVRLSTYSCISFPGFHTFIYHGTMLFTCLVMLLSNYHRYTKIDHWWEMFLACIPTMIVSIPANIVNYSHLNTDYMFFKGHFALLSIIFKGASEIAVTIIVYLLYIIIPSLFYLPSYVKRKRARAHNPLTD